MKKIFIVIMAFFLFGCSTTVPINYIPAPSMKGIGKVFVNNVIYQPFIDKKVKANEIQKAKGAIGTVYASENINDIVKKSFQKELIAAGYDLDNLANLQINLTIDKFLYDWIGFVEVDFYVDITYVVIKDGIEVMKFVTTEHQAAPKTMVSDSEAIRAAMSSSFNNFFIEARKNKIL